MRIVKGDILNATEDFILQQCNCLTVKAHGLSESLGNKFPHARIYNHRRAIHGRNIAVDTDRSIPGTAVICIGTPNIICLFGQWAPGKLGAAYHSYYPASNPVETELQRLLWFISGLSQIGEYLLRESRRVVTIAVPYKIGCGLAGGNWEKYSMILSQFEEKYKSVLSLVMYQLGDG